MCWKYAFCPLILNLHIVLVRNNIVSQKRLWTLEYVKIVTDYGDFWRCLHNDRAKSLWKLGSSVGLDKKKIGFCRSIGNNIIKWCGLNQEVWMCWKYCVTRSGLWGLRCPSHAHCVILFLLPVDSDIELSATSPAPCLPVCLLNSCHDENERDL